MPRITWYFIHRESEHARSPQRGGDGNARFEHRGDLGSPLGRALGLPLREAVRRSAVRAGRCMTINWGKPSPYREPLRSSPTSPCRRRKEQPLSMKPLTNLFPLPPWGAQGRAEGWHYFGVMCLIRSGFRHVKPILGDPLDALSDLRKWASQYGDYAQMTKGETLCGGGADSQ